MEKLERINKYLSEAGVCSRREVDGLIATERVEVNGRPARIGMVIDTERDVVSVDGQRVNPALHEANAISKEALEAQLERPWWVEHKEYVEARDEARRQNPKSKLLRRGAAPAKKEDGAPTLRRLRREVERAKAINTRGHSSEDKQEKNRLVQAAEKAVRAKEAQRAENRRPKSLDEVLGAVDNPARVVKVRRVEGVNPKSSAQRGKKTGQWHGAMRRTRRK